MSDAAYGELLDIGEKSLIEAALCSRDRLPNTPAAIAAAEGHTKVIKALRANLRVFAELPSIDEQKRELVVSQEVSKLARLLDSFIESSPASESSRIDARWERNNWAAAARALHAAADALRTHLGPERRHRTPDAPILDDEQAHQAVARRIAEMLLTVSEAQRRLSLRIQEKAVRGPAAEALRASAALMLESHAGLAEAAGEVIHKLTLRQMPDALASLSSAPLLRPTQLANPITAAQRSFQCIRLMAHRQGRGEMPAGVDAIRAHATTATLVLLHSHAIATAVWVASASAPTAAAQNRLWQESSVIRLRDLARAWDAFARVTERYASTRGSSRLLHHEVNVLTASLTSLTRTGGRWRTPEELLPDGPTTTRLVSLANDALSWLPDLARTVTAIADRLAARGELLMPTRQREDVDHPYRWCPVNTHWAADLHAGCKSVEVATTHLLLRLPASVKSGATNDPVARGMVLPRKSDRLPSPTSLGRPATSIAATQPIGGR